MSQLYPTWLLYIHLLNKQILFRTECFECSAEFSVADLLGLGTPEYGRVRRRA